MKKILLIIFILFFNTFIVFAEDNDASFDEFAEFEEEYEVKAEEKIQVSDPLIKYNRFMFNVNDKLYFLILKPVSKGYSFIVPEKIRFMIRRFFKNLGFPIRVVNNIMQLKLKAALNETERFIINSTIGCLGFFDPAASKFNILESNEDFGQTLGKYGVGEGFCIVLPFLGFSNVRDLFSMFPDYFLNPVNYIDDNKVRLSLSVLDKVNVLSLYPDLYEKLKNEGLDPYTFMRDLSNKDRNNKIRE